MFGAAIAFIALGTSLYQAKPPFYDEIQTFLKADRQAPPAKGQILFVGSSSFAMWTNVQKDFPSHKIINRGFGGSSLPDVIRYADQIIFPYKPKQIVIYCGENDLAGDDKPSAYIVARRFDALHTLIRRKMPTVPLVYVSMKPSPSRRNLMAKEIAANRWIREGLSKDKHATYVDVFTPMLDSTGRPISEIFGPDELHMNEKGYAIWVKILEPVLLP